MVTSLHLVSNPEGSKLLAPGRRVAAHPGLSRESELSIPKGSQQTPMRLEFSGCDPAGVVIKFVIKTPGALLRSDPGLIALIPSGSVHSGPTSTL
jgi:hypothetical protein